jgi:ubiquinone/menaquinone biosynthesis C-methylase UbiE
MANPARDERLKWIYGSTSNAELEERYDGWADLYDKDVEGDMGFAGPRIVAQALAGLIDKTSNVLDAGAGTGAVGEALAALGFEHLTAIDLSPGMLEIASSKGAYETLQREVLGETLGFEDDAFDATICVGTLTVGHAPPSSLDEFIRVTKTGGLVVFGMRPDHYEAGGFKEKQTALENEGRWKLVSRSEPYQMMPTTEPELHYETWVYEVLV